MKQNKKLALALLLSFSLVGIFKVAVPAKGFVDNAPPEITSFSITPLEFDTSEASQTITITLGISDSGVGFCPSSVPGCPSSGTSFIWMHINPMIGNSSQDLLIGDPARISGDANSGVYQITKVVPYGSKDGVWQVSSISLADTLGNHTEYVPTNPGAHQLDLDAIPNATGLQIANTATNSQVTIDKEWTFSSSTVSVTFPIDTIVTKEEGGSFAFYKMVNQSFEISDVTTEGLADGTVVAGKVKIGIPGLNLSFSKPVTVSINVDGTYNDKTLNIETLTEDATNWANETTCTVSNGQCSFTVDHASYFVATKHESGGSGVTDGTVSIHGSAAFLAPKNHDETLWKSNNKGAAQDNSRKFLQEFGKKFGLANPNRDLKFVNQKQDAKGNSHLRYNQTYQGVPVFGGQLIVHMKDSQTVKTVNGKTNVPGQLDTNPKLNQDDAVAQAQKIWSEKEKGEPQVQGTPKLYVYNKKFLAKEQKDDQNYLVWQINLFSSDPYQHKIYFINAQNGMLMDQRDAIKKAVNRRVFNCHDWVDYSACVLEDTINGVDHGRSEGVAARSIADIDNLYDYTGSIHNYFSAKFSRDGANTHGGLGDNSINPYAKTDSYGRMDNDPYRGFYCPDNAFFEDSAEAGGATINFCDNMVTKDVVGHEYTHGVSYFSILDAYGDPYGLDYYYESGALEEGDADIFGEAIENYIDGSNDWLLAEGTPSGPFRSMSDPGSIIDAGIGGYPPRFNSANFYCDFWDNGGVHHNSTVVSHAAYLMAMGGGYNGCSIGAIGRTKEEAVFYQAITHYFTPTTDFNEAYTALNSACVDLYGAGSTDCINVKKALRAVEMDQPGACSGIPATTPQCDFTSSPTVTSVDASVNSGTYTHGDDMDIYVYFSEPVSSTGDVTVTLNSGASCTFTVNNYSFGWCDYLVGLNDNADRLAVTSISGTIQDGDGNAMANFTPADNFGSKAIRIDTAAPVITGVEDGGVYNTDLTPTFNEGAATLNDTSFVSGQTISQEGDYVLTVTDEAGNSTSISFSIEKVSASLTSVPYSTRKNNQRIVFTVYGLNLPGKLKARYFRVHLNGRRIKILSARNSGGNLMLNTRQNYRRWPAGDYNFDLRYSYKYNKTHYQGTAGSDYVLSIE